MTKTHSVPSPDYRCDHAGAASRAEGCIGDALTMIPPVTGNGMSMAFEAAEMTIGRLVAYSRSESSWNEARQSVAAACDRACVGRLVWAR